MNAVVKQITRTAIINKCLVSKANSPLRNKTLPPLSIFVKSEPPLF